MRLHTIGIFLEQFFLLVRYGSFKRFFIPVNQLLQLLGLGGRVVPEKLHTLDHGRPWHDDQFASTRLPSNRDMSR